MSRPPVPHAPLWLSLTLTLLTACGEKEANPAHDAGKAAWVESVALEDFEARKTLGRLGMPVQDAFAVPPLIASRDQVSLVGPEAQPRLMVVYNPMSEPHRAMVVEGQTRLIDVPLTLKDRVYISPRGGAVALYEGLEPHLGPTWTPGAPVRIYLPGKAEPHVIPRGEAVAIGPLLEDGSLILEDGPGRLRRFGPDGALVATLTLPDVHPAEAPPAQPRSRVKYLPTQELIVVFDHTGPTDGQGKRILNGIRLFDLKTGALVATLPQAVDVVGGSAAPDRFVVVEKPGRLALYVDRARTQEGSLPGLGELSIAPDGSFLAVTGKTDKMWLVSGESMNGIWEHSSPAPWNRFLEPATRLSAGGRIFGGRIEVGAEGALVQMQLFTLDAEGNGRVLLERPYRDATIAPIWVVGATDGGKKVVFGAFGEELRILDLD